MTLFAAIIESDPALDPLPTEPFDFDESTLRPSTATSTQTIPAFLTSDIATEHDDSETLEHLSTTDRDPSKFRIALGLRCQEADIFRSRYSNLLEILRLPELQQKVHSLPSCLSTLKRQTTTQLSTSNMNEANTSCVRTTCKRNTVYKFIWNPA